MVPVQKERKTAGEMFGLTAFLTEEIVSMAVDVFDTLEEMFMDLPHNVEKHRNQSEKEREKAGPHKRRDRPA